MALATLRVRTGWYDPAVLKATAGLKGDKSQDATVNKLPLLAVQPGMVFAEDVKTRSGLLLIARGQEVPPSLVVRIESLTSNSKIVERVWVSLCRLLFVASALGTAKPSLRSHSTNDVQQIGNGQSTC